MGAWGYGPFANDDAGNLIARFSRDVERVVNAKTDSAARHRYGYARAAAQIMLLSHHTDILGGPSIELAVRAIARMRGDAEWLGSFREPKRMAAALTGELATLLGRMRACKSCRKKYKKAKNKPEFLELIELAKKANAVKPKRLRRPKIRRVSKAQMKAIRAKAKKKRKKR